MYEFKVGDVVICDKYSIRNFQMQEFEDVGYGGYGWKENRIFTIKSVGLKTPNGRYILWDECNRGVWNTHVSLYVKEIKEYGISKFINSLNNK